MQKQQLNMALQETEKALKALKIAIDFPMQENKMNIDATIQRFEFSIELFWKLLKRILATKGLETQYQKMYYNKRMLAT